MSKSGIEKDNHCIDQLILGISKKLISDERQDSILIQSATNILNELSTKAKDDTAEHGGIIELAPAPEYRARDDERSTKISKTSSNTSSSTSNHHVQLAHSAIVAAGTLRALLYHHGPARGKGRKALIAAISSLTGHQSESKILAMTVLITALSVGTKDVANEEDHRAASRAAVSGVLPGGRYQHFTKKRHSNDSEENNDCKSEELELELELELEKANKSISSRFGIIAAANLLQSASSDSFTIPIDLHILTTFVRAFVSDTSALTDECSKVVRQILHLEQNDEFDENSPRPQVTKLDGAGAFHLAAEVGPWTEISPRLLVDVAISMKLWHSAERICTSAIQFNSPEVDEAVQTLIDGSSERHMYKQSDKIATEFYDNGGRSRYAEARFMHACDTISKVVVKRQYPIIERQVERVDRAFERIKEDHATNTEDPGRNGPLDIREFVLTRLGECNEHDAADRLAKLWNMHYWYDEADAEKHVKARKERYLQWEHIFPHAGIPELVSCPITLKAVFIELISSRDKVGCVGFDVEWGDSTGAALLQLSTERMAILIDVPALSSSEEGCESLECTVGNLFAGNDANTNTNANVSATNRLLADVRVVGFSCREDLSRLRASSNGATKPWFTETKAFTDIKPLIEKHKPQLKHLGLSRICDYYLGKPLDKAEQCSLWERRPLTDSQSVYAALDAWAVARLWISIHENGHNTQYHGSGQRRSENME